MYLLEIKKMCARKIFSINNTYSVDHSHESLNSDVFSIISINEDDRPPEYYFFSEYLTELE